MDLRRQLMEGRVAIRRVGSVELDGRPNLPFVLVDGHGAEVEPVSEYLRERPWGIAACIRAVATRAGCCGGSGCCGRWTSAGIARRSRRSRSWWRGCVTAPHPQRERSAASPAAGSVNLVTGKAMLGPGYSKRTINHAMSVVSGFYAHHGRFGRGPVVNPVPSSPQRRRALSHLSPLESKPAVGRARLRQKVSDRPPRAIPDDRWDELFAAMGCERDRALLEFSVSSGARAAELLGVCPEDID